MGRWERAIEPRPTSAQGRHDRARIGGVEKEFPGSSSFYRRYAETGNAPRSLGDVQREWLVRLREVKGLVHAVNRAGAFIMSSQGQGGSIDGDVQAR